MQQIRNTWLKEIGTIKLSCFNGDSVTIQCPRMASNDKELTAKSNRESREIISLSGRQRDASTFVLGELPARGKADFTF
jgi:hypothetical protein